MRSNYKVSYALPKTIPWDYSFLRFCHPLIFCIQAMSLFQNNGREGIKIQSHVSLKKGEHGIFCIPVYDLSQLCLCWCAAPALSPILAIKTCGAAWSGWTRPNFRCCSHHMWAAIPACRYAITATRTASTRATRSCPTRNRSSTLPVPGGGYV